MEAWAAQKVGMQADWKALQEGHDLWDIRQGFRVAILDTPPAPAGTEKVWPPPKTDRLPATQKETIKVYEAYLKMLEMDGKTVWQQDACKTGVICGISRVSWRRLISWVETSSFGLDVRRQCSYEALFKALKTCHREQSDEECKKEVSLFMIVKWMWPFAGPRRMTEMIFWICEHECSRLRLPVPPPIAEQDRQQMTRLFHKMDLDGKGYCLPFDIAGGDHSDITVATQNTVDEATVKEVLGDRIIHLSDFFELMCENGYRGAPESKRAVTKDGDHIVWHIRESLGWQAWVYVEAPPEQEEMMRRIDAVEAEFLQWRCMV